MKVKKSEFPGGWDETRVRGVLEHYESQTPEDAAAEHKAALSRPATTLIEVPVELVPAVRELIAEHQRKPH